MNDLFIEVDYGSLNKHQETLCGDHVEMIHQDNQKVIVLADGLGSGVKANILSTLTSKIIATMMANGMSLKDCIETIAHTLPICKVREIAYSTFTLLRFIDAEVLEMIQFDNPYVIIIRDGRVYDYHRKEMDISDKKIYYSRFEIHEDDLIIAMSDGCVHAGVGKTLNFGWQRKDIAEYMRAFYRSDLTAKSLVHILLDKCNDLYDHLPGDDTTACIARIVKRQPIHVMIGPPSQPSDEGRAMRLFFSKEGKRVVCGGTTSDIVGKYLNKTVKTSLTYVDPKIPPVAYIDGIDLVTEGVITINQVLAYAKDYLKDNQKHKHWGYKKDGASLLSKMLIEESTDIHFYVGRAINPAHQNPDLPIQFNIKMQLVDSLKNTLEAMGKHITMTYF